MEFYVVSKKRELRDLRLREILTGLSVLGKITNVLAAKPVML